MFYYDSDGGCCSPRGEISEEVEGLDVTWYYDGEDDEITSIGTPSGNCYLDKELPRFFRHLEFWMPEVYKKIIDHEPDLDLIEAEEPDDDTDI